MDLESRKAVKVSDDELNDIKKFFSENYGAKTEADAKGYASMATLWRFLATGRARPAIVISIRKFIDQYEPATI